MLSHAKVLSHADGVFVLLVSVVQHKCSGDGIKDLCYAQHFIIPQLPEQKLELPSELKESVGMEPACRAIRNHVELEPLPAEGLSAGPPS